MKAETQAGKHTISLVGALHGELQPLVAMERCAARRSRREAD